MAFQSTSATKKRFVIATDNTNKGTQYVEVEGKKKALKAAGLPSTLAACTPGESRWGQSITIEQALQMLSNTDAKRGPAGHIVLA